MPVLWKKKKKEKQLLVKPTKEKSILSSITSSDESPLWSSFIKEGQGFLFLQEKTSHDSVFTSAYITITM